MLEFVLVLMIVGGGGSSPRPAVSIESINFKSQESCEMALHKAKNTRLPSVGPNFKLTGFCTQNI